jgi:hypothetical protein
MTLRRRYRTTTALAALLPLAALPVVSLADNWQPVGETKGATAGMVYINMDSVRDEGGYRVATFLTILATDSKNSHDIKLDRFAQETAFDCAKHTFSPLATTGYLAGKKVGTSFDKGDWRSSFKGLPADPVAQGAFDLACKSPVAAHPSEPAQSSAAPATVELAGPPTDAAALPK